MSFLAVCSSADLFKDRIILFSEPALFYVNFVIVIELVTKFCPMLYRVPWQSSLEPSIFNMFSIDKGIPFYIGAYILWHFCVCVWRSQLKFKIFAIKLLYKPSSLQYNCQKLLHIEVKMSIPAFVSCIHPPHWL